MFQGRGEWNCKITFSDIDDILNTRLTKKHLTRPFEVAKTM